MKKILGIFLVITMLLSFSTVLASENIIEIYLDNVKLDIPEEMGVPFIENGRTMVPLRIISQELGKHVDWDQENQIVDINNGSIKVKIGSNTIETPNGSQTVDAPPKIIDGRTYIGIRFVSETLGYEVSYERIRGIDCVYIKTGINSDTPIENEDGTIVVDGTEYGKNIGDYSETGVSQDVIGSNSSLLLTRQENSSLSDDVDILNKALESTIYGLTKDGYFQSGGRDINDPNSPLRINRDSNDNPVLSLGDWIVNKNDEQFTRMKVIVNTAIETAKYYSNSVSDAKAIIDFFDNCVKTSTDPDYNKTYTFGTTKVKFEDEVSWGVNIIFVK